MSSKNLRELIGFLGVVASLVFVGLEVRQNTIASRAAAYQELGLHLATFWSETARDPVMADLVMTGYGIRTEADLAQFSPQELRQLVLFWVGNLRQYEATWRQIELGLLDESVLTAFGWRLYGEDIGGDMALRVLWPRSVRAFMSEDFAVYLESSVDFDPPSP